MRRSSNAPREYNSGRWSEEEHGRFVEALKRFGQDWPKIATFVGTRPLASIRSHGQKFFNRLAASGLPRPGLTRVCKTGSFKDPDGYPNAFQRSGRSRRARRSRRRKTSGYTTRMLGNRPNRLAARRSRPMTETARAEQEAEVCLPALPSSSLSTVSSGGASSPCTPFSTATSQTAISCGSSMPGSISSSPQLGPKTMPTTTAFAPAPAPVPVPAPAPAPAPRPSRSSREIIVRHCLLHRMGNVGATYGLSVKPSSTTDMFVEVSGRSPALFEQLGVGDHVLGLSGVSMFGMSAVGVHRLLSGANGPIVVHYCLAGGGIPPPACLPALQLQMENACVRLFGGSAPFLHAHTSMRGAALAAATAEVAAGAGGDEMEMEMGMCLDSASDSSSVSLGGKEALLADQALLDGDDDGASCSACGLDERSSVGVLPLSMHKSMSNMSLLGGGGGGGGGDSTLFSSPSLELLLAPSADVAPVDARLASAPSTPKLASLGMMMGDEDEEEDLMGIGLNGGSVQFGPPMTVGAMEVPMDMDDGMGAHLCFSGPL